MEKTIDFKSYALELASKARKASQALMDIPVIQKNFALEKMAELIRARSQDIKNANEKDIQAAQQAGLSAAMIDRLRLTDARIEAMAVSIDQVAAQTDPVGQILDGYIRPNGLRIEKVRVPIGVIAIIFEARPNVTADAASLCLRSSNACILRGGKEAIHSNQAIVAAIREALGSAALPIDAVQLVEHTDRALVPELLQLDTLIDLAIPRGGESLIRAVVAASKVPVIKHYTGNCHVYVDKDANLAMAEKIVVNAKCQRPGVCNATETVLIHQAIAEKFVPAICGKLSQRGVEVRGCPQTRTYYPQAAQASEEDWAKEYLDLIVAMKVVASVDEAAEHINHFGSPYRCNRYG
jgi:glutamate-5-semialdehyde dehydrogenase